ncbi:MAG: N-acetylmuramoyl-L-alanine amidase [Trueperaceae bacterium]|nr:MAG: N-acetylmuramoyl-L-alanine amidase [Trueperaceae bacterium]
MKRTLVALFSLISILGLQLAAAQERHNYLAIDGELQDDAGPFYFIQQGDNRNAFAKTLPLAEALGLEFTFDEATSTLEFTDGIITATLEATSDIVAGLVKRTGLLQAAGQLIDSPMALLVNGTSYVPITPIVTAFGGTSEWHAEARVITVETAATLTPLLAPPRVGHNEGVSRIALDLPLGQSYQVQVREYAMIITLPSVRVPSYNSFLEDPNLRSVSFEVLGSDVALIIQTNHLLAANGQGYRLGELNHPERDVLYVDFAPTMAGEQVAEAVVDLAAAMSEELPSQNQVVVIDAGHGGKFAGARGYAKEEEVVLSVALMLQSLLQEQGVEVVLTRDDDSHLSTNYNEELAARARYATPERNLFVSIHANAADSQNAQGIETWVFGEPLDPSLIDIAILENGGGVLGEMLTQEALQSASNIAGDILRETQLNYSLGLAELVQEHLISATGARDRGVRQNVFYVIRNARTPAILVEIGFVSHPEEGRKLTTEDYQTIVAEGLAEGILEFLTNGGILAGR